MKKIGIIGGLGPESTLDYYKGIINAFKPDYEKHGYPEISIESVDLRTFVNFANNGEWHTIANFLAEKFEILRKNGADFGAIASNTPHKVFPTIQEKTSLPLISIVEATCDYAEQLGLSKLCLLGTKFTMESDFFQNIFNPRNIDLVVPSAEEQEYIQKKLFSEIEFGIIKKKTKDSLIAIYQRMLNEYGTDGVILGCTELPLIIKPNDVQEKYLDTTAIHIEKIVEYCKS